MRSARVRSWRARGWLKFQRRPGTPSEKIDQLIASIADWRGQTFAAVRKAVLDADPDIIEE